jgi:cell division protein ZapA
MMKVESMEHIEVRILDRDYTLAVEPDERQRLLDAVRIVDARMRAIREAGRVTGADRIAVMAALQLAHEWLGNDAVQQDPRTDPETIRRLREMTDTIDRELAQHQSPY